MLTTLGHPQPTTAVKTDNSTAASFVKDLIKQRRSKSWDVRYHWLSEKQNENFFNIYWDSGKNNLSDYHTKHHPPSHHKKVRQNYILKGFFMKLINLQTKNNKSSSNLTARVCSYPTLRGLRTNVPARYQRLNITDQRSNITVTNNNKRERLALLS